jgi:cullin-4
MRSCAPRNHFVVHVCSTTVRVVTLQDKEMVERLLQLKSQLDDVLGSAFQASPAFADQLTSAFQSAVNSRSNKPAELVAKFIDAKLRGSKGVGEGELEAALDKALVLFGYIQVRGSVGV